MLNAYHVLGIVLFNVLPYLFLKTNSQGSFIFPHLSDKTTEAQSGYIILEAGQVSRSFWPQSFLPRATSQRILCNSSNKRASLGAKFKILDSKEEGSWKKPVYVTCLCIISLIFFLPTWGLLLPLTNLLTSKGIL